MADLDLGDSKVDPELQEFLMLEKQKAQVNAQVRKLFDFKEFSSIATFWFRLTDSWVQWNMLGQMCWQARIEARQQNRDMSYELCGSLHRYIAFNYKPLFSAAAKAGQCDGALN